MKETDFNPELFRELAALKGKGESEIRLGCRLILNSKLSIAKPAREVLYQWARSLHKYELETQGLLAEVFASQRTWEQFPDWQAAGMAPSVEVKWLRAQLHHDPDQGLKEQHLWRLREALLTLKPVSRKGWERLLGVVLNHPDSIIYRCVIPLLRMGIVSSCLSSGFLQETVREALQKEDLPLVEKACQFIQEHYSLIPNCPEKELRMLTRKGAGYEPLGVKTLALWGPHSLLDEVLEGESWEISSKWEALKAKSNHPDTGSLAKVLSLLERYPERAFELSKLLAQHAAQGVHPRKQQLASLFALYLGGLAIPSPTMVSLVTPKTAVAILDIPAPTETIALSNWISFWDTYPGAVAEEKFAELLNREDHPHYLNRMLAIGVRRNFTSLESILLEKFDLAPLLYLDALKKLGGSKTIVFLKERLFFDHPRPVNLPKYEKEALQVLFVISQHQEELLEYMRRRNVHNPGEFLPFFRSKPPISLSKTILEELDNADESMERMLLDKLEEIGDFDVLPALIRFTAHEEEGIAQRAGEVCISIVKRSHQVGNIYPRSLMNQAPEVAFRSVLSQLVLDKVQQEVRTEKLQRYLQFLGTIAWMPIVEQYATHLFSHSDPQVVKYALASFSSTQHSSFSHYFQPFLQPEQDIYTLRQALIGAKESGDSSLEPWVLPFLTHRNMNIKKTAAEFLARHGTQQAVPHLVRWLGDHDNPGFRAVLQGALKRILSQNFPFLLLNEIEKSERPARQKHLIAALLELWEDSWTLDKDLDFPSLSTSSAFLDWQKAKTKTAAQDDSLQNWVLEWHNQNNLFREQVDAKTLTIDEALKQSVYHPETSPEVLQDIIPGKLRAYLHTHPKERGHIGERLAQWEACVTTEEARWVFAAASSLPAREWALKQLLLEPDAPEATVDHIEKLEGMQPKMEVWAHKIHHQSQEEALEEAMDSWLGLFRTQSTWQTQKLSQSGLSEQLIRIFYQLQGIQETDIADRIKLVLRWLIDLNPLDLMDFFRSIWSSLSIEIRMDLLSAFTKSQIQALEPELLALYPSLPIQKRESLIQKLRKVPGLFALRRLAFGDYLETGKSVFVDFWDQQNTSEGWQIKMIVDHPKAFDYLEKHSDALKFFPDSLLSQYISERERRVREEKGFLSAWQNFPINRLWNLVEPFLQAGKWSLLKLLPAHTPVNSQLLALLQQASQNEQVIILEWLAGFPSTLYFPGLEDQLFTFLRKWDSPHLLYQLLLKMDLWGENPATKCLSRFLDHLRNASFLHQNALAQHLRAQPAHPLLKQPAFRKLLIQQNESQAFHPSLISLVILGTNWHDREEAQSHLRLFSSLISQDQDTGLEVLDIILEQLEALPTPLHLSQLEQLFQHPQCQSKVSLALSRLLLRESLLMEMLSPKVADQFGKQICQEIRLGNSLTEMELKAVLRRLSETPFPELIDLLKYLLLESRQKKLKHAAFRLLRTTLPHTEFQEVCLTVLVDSPPDLARAAARSLIFAKQKAVLPYLVDFLFHRQKALQETAKDGLLRFGLSALSPLRKALSRTSRDRKKTLTSLIQEIENQHE